MARISAAGTTVTDEGVSERGSGRLLGPVTVCSWTREKASSGDSGAGEAAQRWAGSTDVMTSDATRACSRAGNTRGPPCLSTDPRVLGGAAGRGWFTRDYRQATSSDEPEVRP